MWEAMQRRADDNELISFATQNCCAYGHPEIVIRCDQTTSLDAPHLLAWIENMVASGRTFLAGKTIQIGSSVASIRPTGDGRLALFEPDFQGMPLTFIPSLCNTLLAIRKQKNVLDSLGLDQQRVDFPSIWHSVLRCR